MNSFTKPPEREVELAVAVVMADENFPAADQLHVARRRLADGHDPVFRLVAFVDVQQRRVALVNGDEFVLDRIRRHHETALKRNELLPALFARHWHY